VPAGHHSDGEDKEHEKEERQEQGDHERPHPPYEVAPGQRLGSGRRGAAARSPPAGHRGTATAAAGSLGPQVAGGQPG
jgi:hypothetical protein